MSLELATYDGEFKAKVLAIMFQKPEFLRFVATTLKPEHFGTEVDRTFAKMFLDFFKELPKSKLTKTVVKTELLKLFTSGKAPLAEKEAYAERFEKLTEPVKEAEWIEKEISQFLTHVALEQALLEMPTLLEKKKYDDIFDRITKVKTSTTLETAVEDARFTSRVEDYVRRLKDPEDLGSRDGIPTGIAELDDYLFFHGVDRKEMFVYCGPPGRGKSVAMLNQGIAGILHGVNVLYYTLEVSEKVYETRFNACITGVPAAYHAKKPEEIVRRWGLLRKAYPDMGEFVLRDLPSRVLRPNSIRRDLTYYKETGIDIGMVVVDYADIMSSDKVLKLEDKRLEVGDVYEQLRSIAKEFNIAMVTASQGNRASLNKAEIDIDSLAEDFSKAFTADYVVGICQTKKDALERTEWGGCTSGLMNLYIAKNRNEKRGVRIPVWTDYICLRMSYEDWGKFDERIYGIPYRRV